MKMKLKVLSLVSVAVFLIFIGLPDPSRASVANPNLNTLITMGGNPPSDTTPSLFAQWLSQHFDTISWPSGAWSNPHPYNPAANWFVYIEGTSVTNYQNQNADNNFGGGENSRRIWYESQPWSAGYPWEDTLIHSDVDHANSLAWTGYDQFDRFDYNGSNRKQGVMTYENGVFRDNTHYAYSGSQTASLQTKFNDTLYIGYSLPFDQINFTLIQVAQGSPAIAWEYWNGTGWADFVTSQYFDHGGNAATNPFVDGTSGMTRDGRVSFYPPSDWTRTTVNNSISKWWIRARISGGTVKPIINTIKGDDWRTATVGMNRGWSSTDANRVNVGLADLEYNPNPPIGATAKFKYQSRYLIYSSAFGYYTMNKALSINGHYPAAEYLAYRALNAPDPGHDGVMFDDPDVWPTGNVSFARTEYNSQIPANYASADALNIAFLGHVADAIHAQNPNFKVGANIYKKGYLAPLDWAWIEMQYIPSSGTLDRIPVNNGAPWINFDDILSMKPGYKSYMVFYDSPGYDSSVGFANSGPLRWDKGNRGPMMSLASYYIGANDKTGFAYNAIGTTGYDQAYTDQFKYLDDRSTVLTSPITADTSPSTIKTILGNDFSGFPSSSIQCLTIGSGDTMDVIVSNVSPYTVPYVKDGADPMHKITTQHKIYFDHAAGEPVGFCNKARVSATASLPAINKIIQWNQYFPAMSVNIGVPNGSGLAGGQRTNVATGENVWAAGQSANIGGGQPLARRDYTNAIVVARQAKYGVNDNRAAYTTFSNSVCITGGAYPNCTGPSYYPLYADGTTGAAITSISLRHAEGAILMRAPIGGGDVTAPAIPSGLRVN